MGALIEFTGDFATRKKGERWECDGPLAAHLVAVDKVAKFVSEQTAEKPTKATKAKKEVEPKIDKE